MMNVQVSCGPTTLAPPSISSQHLVSDRFVDLGIKLQSGLFLAQAVHFERAQDPETKFDPLEG